MAADWSPPEAALLALGVVEVEAVPEDEAAEVVMEDIEVAELEEAAAREAIPLEIEE